MTKFNPMGPGDDLRTFKVRRTNDGSGTSGVGDVAVGVVFPDGTTVVQWQTRARSVVIYSSWVDALYIHGHGDDTGFVFDADPTHVHFSDGSSRVTMNLDDYREGEDPLLCHCHRISEKAGNPHICLLPAGHLTDHQCGVHMTENSGCAFEWFTP